MSEIFCTQKQCINLECIHHRFYASYDDPAIWADMSKDCEYKAIKNLIEYAGGKNDNDK